MSGRTAPSASGGAETDPMIESTQTYRDQLADRLFRHRTLLLTGEVNDEMAERVCAELVLLAAADDERDIVLHINSPGGSVLAGLAIHDTMALVPNDVVTVAVASPPAWDRCCSPRGPRASGSACRTAGS